MKNRIIAHYDRLIELDNDPARDPEPLRQYMDGWDGEAFIEQLCLEKTKSVLEVGVGTGRLAQRIALECGSFCGIDLSPKTVERARENLAELKNVRLICADFLSHEFAGQFDVIYSSLTFMHIFEKQKAVEKIAALLKPGGRAVISIDKNRQPFIDVGFGRLEIRPDDPAEMEECFVQAGLKPEATVEIDFAFILSAKKL